MGSDVPQNRGNTSRVAILSEEDDFGAAVEVANIVIDRAVKVYGTVGRAISVLSRTYKLKPAWLQRLREGRSVPVYRYAFNNLLVALDDIEARLEAAAELERARINEIKKMGQRSETADVRDRPDPRGRSAMAGPLRPAES